MRWEAPDKRFYAEIRDLNLGFLGLMAHPRATSQAHVLLGIDPAVPAALAGLSPEQRAFAADLPVLLAGFASLPPVRVVEDAKPMSLDPAWLADAQLYTCALLTYLWQLSARDRLSTALCVGPGSALRQRLAGMKHVEIQTSVPGAVRQLRARQAGHPHLWPELLRAARAGDRERRDWCRLNLLPLGLATLQ